jgi:hypothetical protein
MYLFAATSSLGNPVHGGCGSLLDSGPIGFGGRAVRVGHYQTSAYSVAGAVVDTMGLFRLVIAKEIGLGF